MVARLEPGLLVAGRYRIEIPLGEGGMGIVYRVRHVHTDEALAMKVLHAHVLRDESAVERFRREARAPARIASEHVARVTDADTAPDLGNAPFYVMELLHGMDLERLVSEQGALPPSVVVELLRQTARALDKAHAIGIVHRDLKPENLFLTHREDGSPWIKLLDFGIARIADDASTHKKTQAGYVFGTPAYMAPEQAMGDVDRIGPATDVWALGLVAFKLLTGQDFWDAQTAAQLIAMTVSGPIPSPTQRGASVGASFDAWFPRCVTRAPADRFASAGEAVAALADALGITLPPSEAAPLRSVRSSAPSFAPAASSRLRTSSASPMSLSHHSQAAPRRGLVRRAWLAGGVALVIACGLATFAIAPRVTSRDPARATAASGVAPAPPSPPVEAADAAISPLPPPAEERREATAATDESEAPRASAPKEAPPRSRTRGQEQRLRALQRLCAQGTFTADECRSKQATILREP